MDLKSHLVTLKELLGIIIGIIVVLGGFAVYVIGAADAKAQGANRRMDEVYLPRLAGLEEREVTRSRAEAAEHELIRSDVRALGAEVTGGRSDMRAIYTFLLTKERQPQLERPPPPVNPSTVVPVPITP